MAVQYFRVRKLEEYQDARATKWAKVHFTMLSDYEFTQLTNAQRWVYIGLIMLACQQGNRVPRDLGYLSKTLAGPVTDGELDGLIQHGFIQMCNTDEMTTSSQRAHAPVSTNGSHALDKKREEEKERGEETARGGARDWKDGFDFSGWQQAATAAYPAGQRGNVTQVSRALFSLTDPPPTIPAFIAAVEELKQSRKWREGYGPSLHNFVQNRGWEEITAKAAEGPDYGDQAWTS